MPFIWSLLLLVSVSLSASAAVLTVEPGTGTYPTINDANRAAAPGDTVLVRGGIYRENLRMRQVGTADNYTVFKAYPGETAILDGSMPLQGWTPCASAVECGGNPNWQHIYRAAPGRPVRLLSDNLFEGEKMLHRGQRPAPADPLFGRSPEGMQLIPAGGFTAATITDPVFFTQATDGYWVNGELLLFTGDTVYTRRITAYSAAEHKITFESLPVASADYGTDRYALSNHIMLVNGPGDYYGDEDNDVYYLWPYDPSSLDSMVTLTTRNKGFVIDGAYMVVEDFVIRRFYDNAVYVDNARDIIFKNNKVLQVLAKEREPAVLFVSCTNGLAENNHIHHNRYGAGLMFRGGLANTARGNLVDMNGGSGIMFHGTTNSLVGGNTVLNHRGPVAHGISAVGNLTLNILGNFVRSGNTALYFRNASNIIIKNNFLHSDGWAAACMNTIETPQANLSYNTLVSGSSYAYHSEPGAIANLVLVNNIIQGMPAAMKGDASGNNVFIDVPGYNPVPDTGEVLTDLSGVFCNPAAFDYRPAAGSPAIDAGISAEMFEDIAGAPRPYNGIYDAGAWEYQGVPADSAGPEILTITTGRDDSTRIVVAFNEALALPGACAVSKYAVSGGVAVVRTTVGDDSTAVTLITSGLTEGQDYYLTVNYVRDAAGNSIAPSTTVRFTYPGVSGIGEPPARRMVVPAGRGSGVMYDITGRAVTAPAGRRNGIFLVPVDGVLKKVMIVE